METVAGSSAEPRRWPGLAVLGLAIGSAAATWSASSSGADRWPDHQVGPYHFSLRLEVVLGSLALAVGLASWTWIVVAVRRRRATGLWWATSVLLVLTAVFAAAAWRMVTVGVGGANIGGGLAWVTGPVIIAGLLVAAALTEQAHRNGSRRRRGAFALVAALAAPLLYLFEHAVTEYDEATGVITAEQYASVRPGQPEADVRDRLGRASEPIDWFFAPPPPAAHCTYYDSGRDEPEVYRVCFSNGVVLRKDRSREPYGFQHP